MEFAGLTLGAEVDYLVGSVMAPEPYKHTANRSVLTMSRSAVTGTCCNAEYEEASPHLRDFPRGHWEDMSCSSQNVQMVSCTQKEETNQRMTKETKSE